MAPAEPLRVDGPWALGQQRGVTAAYIVPIGFRDLEEAEHGLRRRFYGYAVQVYYKGVLQDAAARPAALMREIMKTSASIIEDLPPAR